MIILYNQKWISWQTIYMGEGIKPYGWCCWPFILFSGTKGEVTERMLKHEKYHWWHQLKWLIIPYHITYIILWFVHGYWNHPWEVRARRAELE